MKWIVSKTYQHTLSHTNAVMALAVFWDDIPSQQQQETKTDVSELSTQETNNSVGHFLPKPFSLLGRLHQGQQSHQSLAKHLALLLQGDRLLHGRTDPKKLTHFLKSPTEARGRREASKPTHGIVPLFNATVILFQLIVEIMTTLVENVLAKDLVDRTWVRTVPIRDHSRWRMINCLESLLEKALGGVHISLLTEHGVKQIPILINGTIQIAPFSLDPYVDLSELSTRPRNGWKVSPLCLEKDIHMFVFSPPIAPFQRIFPT